MNGSRKAAAFRRRRFTAARNSTRSPATKTAASSPAASKKAAAKTVVPAVPTGRSRAVRLLIATGLWTACALVAVLHAALLSMLTPTGSPSSTGVDWLLLLVPALATLVALPSSIRHWYRWATFVAVIIISTTQWTLFALVVAEAWVLHREWVVDRVPGELNRLVPASVKSRLEARRKPVASGSAKSKAAKSNSLAGRTDMARSKSGRRRPV